MKFMFRLVCLLFLTGAFLQATAQGVEVKKSTDVVVIRGTSFYLHTVQPGQTLYSICRTYGVAVEELKRLNDKADDRLSLYEVLKVPFVEEHPFVQRDDKYYYHRVVKGETIYSIARHYSIKPKRLLKYNSEYADAPLAVGAVVKLPLKEIRLPEVMETETHHGMAETGEMTEERHHGVRDSLRMHTEGWDEHEYVAEEEISPESLVKVALLLPFFAQEYPLFRESEGGMPMNISARSEQFVSFYEGILLAVDSLKNKGYKIDLHVFDTQRGEEKMSEMADELNSLQPDLIIGPVYASMYRNLIARIENRRVPVVYPLSSRRESFSMYPNFVQVNASFETLIGEMAKWLASRSGDANLIYLQTGSEGDSMEEKEFLRDTIGGIEGMRTFFWDMEQVPLDSLRTFLLPEVENILVMPTSKEAEVSKMLPLLSALTDAYRISVVGLPEWQWFSSVDHETYYKVNTRLFTYSYVDYASEPARRLTEKYRRYFYTDPSTLVFKAFDMGMYFIKMVAQYRENVLEAIGQTPRKKDFSVFRFEPVADGMGQENHAFYMVHFTSGYRVICR